MNHCLATHKSPHFPESLRLSRHTRFISSSLRRRHHRRRLLKPGNPLGPTIVPTTANPSSSSTEHQTLQIVLPLDQLNTSPFVASCKSHFNQFIVSGREAFRDLQTLVIVDRSGPGKRVVFSCRKSTVEFLGTLFVSSFVIFLSLRTLFKLIAFGFKTFSNIRGSKNVELVYRRDRSLGGKEVLVAKKEKSNDFELHRKERSRLNIAENEDEETESIWEWGRGIRTWREKRDEYKLPAWWPVSGSVSGQVMLAEYKEEYQRMANRLIQAIMDEKVGGKDVSEDDIIELRHICKISGVRVSISTANSRDSFYRTSVNFVLNYCERLANQSASVQIDGEDPQHFVAGLAYNICQESERAAKMVSAAVAARTRSRFLQAWALEMQGHHSDAVLELAKVCFIHRIFPPEECSPEMEMVARGLAKHLKLEQRQFLMNTLVGACGEETHGSIAEALGLDWNNGLGYHANGFR